MKIFDSSVIIAFYSELNDPTLLHIWKKLGHKLYIPIGVKNEIYKGITQRMLKKNIESGVIEVLDNSSKEKYGEYKNRYPYLGRGEIEVILWGIHFKEKNIKCYCILDDKKARQIADLKNLNYTGTVGLIQKLTAKKKLSPDESRAIFEKLRTSGFRV